VEKGVVEVFMAGIVSESKKASRRRLFKVQPES